MPFRKVSFLGFTLGITADKYSAGISIAYNGSLWKALTTSIQRKRRKQMTDKHAADVEKSSAQPAPVAQGSLQEQINSTYWYHTLHFDNGLTTPGQFDQNPILDRYCLPERLEGKRVLDVATFDGFWAFELEKRGASEVLALDVEGPADCDYLPSRMAQATEEELSIKFGRGFAIAKAAYNSKVERVICNVYDLSPDQFGMFDVVHSGDFLIHLNNPVKALQNIAKVCREYAIISDVYDPSLEAMGERKYLQYHGGHNDVTWWSFSLSGLRAMIEDAGFVRVELIADFTYGQRGHPENMHHAVFKAYK
ncbi:tRNA (mo5U34)-methyltransferase [Marisediminitalea aggregata]|uniref:tRNA (Mo5U34)-methyltransferase n=1 Tax=Marisediminitalea aggregata TaxID=634436 RepID=A0A1M5EI53_9ALTE|nr:methyltransferase domain-containing protein [Marisediminitalea aggregata]SHF78846.1 tRNA (mo5U34)-methyltransferase [Marisediminitalea aggregata]